MRFDLARQPLIPAFLSLVILLSFALCNTADGVVVPNLYGGIAPEKLPIASFGGWLEQFRAAHGGWAHTLAALLLLTSAMTIGRMTARFKLYGISTFIAMPLFMLSMMGVMHHTGWFSATVATTLMTLAVKNFCYSFRNGFSFDATFRGGLYLALTLLVMPKAAPLLMMLPIALVLFRRATRENLVAICGLLLPPLTWAYLNWAFGGSFSAPFRLFWNIMIEGDWFLGVLHWSLTEQIFGGALLLLNLFAVALFLANSYTLSTRSRHTLLFASYMLLLVVGTALLPDADSSVLALMAVPSALLLPVLFIRIRRTLTQLLYPLLVVAALFALLYGA